MIANHAAGIVVCGITTNHCCETTARVGGNLGHDVTYSGTVTAVMESIIWGVPGVAVSLDGGDQDSAAIDWDDPTARRKELISEYQDLFASPYQAAQRGY